MNATGSEHDGESRGGSDDADVVRLDRVGEKVKRKRADERAAELATRFHRAMGWKGTPDKPGGKDKGKRGKKKR